MCTRKPVNIYQDLLCGGRLCGGIIVLQAVINIGMMELLLRVSDDTGCAPAHLRPSGTLTFISGGCLVYF